MRASVAVGFVLACVPAWADTARICRLTDGTLVDASRCGDGGSGVDVSSSGSYPISVDGSFNDPLKALCSGLYSEAAHNTHNSIHQAYADLDCEHHIK